MTDTPSPTDIGTQVFFWPRCFVLRTRDFAQRVDVKPYQRLAATLIVSIDAPFNLRINDGPSEQYNVALLSPDARRHELRFNNSDSFLFDIGLSTAEYDQLKPLLRYGEAVVPKQSKELLKYLGKQAGSALDSQTAKALLTDVVSLIAPTTNKPAIRDARISRVLQLIDELPRDELSVSGLAAEVGLSESRLRNLSQRYLGCSLSRYMRWIAAWRSVEIWRPGMSFTEVAHAAGFHDLPHANRTFNELFGMAPSRMLRSPDIVVQRCD